MIDGIANHGLPYILNGPSHAYPELRARWNVERGGRLWGTYPPMFAYAAAPLYRVGGSRAVIKGNVVLLAILAIGIWAVARRVTGSETLGSVCSIVCVLATPVSAMALLLSPYVLATCFVVWSVLVAIKAVDNSDKRVLAFAAGLLAGLGAASHLIAFPVLVWVAAALTLPVMPEDGVAHRFQSRPFWARGLAVLAGGSVPLAAMAAVNHMRFGTWNPLTYGPCSWRLCSSEVYQPLGFGTILGFVLPLALWLSAGVILAWLIRRRGGGWFIAAAASITVLALFPALAERAQRLAIVITAFLVDVSVVDFLYRNYVEAREGPGVFFGPFVVKSVLQGMPFLTLALLAPVWRWRRQWPLFLVGGAAASILAGVILRGATQTGAHTLGYPFLFIRHLVPALPLLVVVAVAAVSKLRWRWWHLVLGTGLASLFGLWLIIGETDHGLLRRLVLLRGSLVLSALAPLVIAIDRKGGGKAFWSKLSVAAVIVSVSFGVAVGSGLDLPAVAHVVQEKDRYVDRVAQQTPYRFAVVGYPQQIDPLAALRLERDFEYADLYETRDSGSVSELIEWWLIDDRPVFVFLPTGSQVRPLFYGFPLREVDGGIGLFRIPEKTLAPHKNLCMR
jgi:4-amino-4-deoxy-L-arabinose transferase-like glycosyltransferase